MRRNEGERGQVVIVLLVALAIFIFAAIGLAIDGAHLYAQRQMAQAAADATAQAAIMSVFDHTYNAHGGSLTDFPAAPSTSFTCATWPSSTPCVYAQRNSFGTAKDTVVVDYPDASVIPAGVNLAAPDPVNLARATVTRVVDTTLIRLLGPTASSVKAIGIAAVTLVLAPVPILVTHPTLPESLKLSGNPTIRICGGPGQSIQVNSSSGTVANPGRPAYSPGGSVDIDLSRAGTASTGTCLDSPTGANFGVFGGLTAPPVASQGNLVNFVNLGPNGNYLQPNSPIEDPLAGVGYPPVPSGGGMDPAVTPPGSSGCPDASFKYKDCHLFNPGYYANGICVQNLTAVFKPGIYYMASGATSGNCKGIGFGNLSNGVMVMASGFPDDSITGPGMLVYNVSPDTAIPMVFDVGANSVANLVGTPLNSDYKGILFFQRREAPAPSLPQVHRFGGGGEVSLVGTIYITNTRQNMKANPAWYQPVLLQGGPGSGTILYGEIIVSTLELGGGGMITMNLSPDLVYTIRKVALVR